MQMNKTYRELFEIIRGERGMGNLWLKILNMLRDLEPSVSDAALKLFCIYFSLLDDGNTCIALDEKLLAEKWEAKWKGLLLVSGHENTQDYSDWDFTQVIRDGINEISSSTIPALVAHVNLSDATDDLLAGIPVPFVTCTIDGCSWLFTTKFFTAKNSIEKSIRRIFRKSDERINLKEKSAAIIEEFKEITGGFRLKEEQADIIVRGFYENLIVTGKPGTGKTTVICFLLWKLLQDPAYARSAIYLAAPSGKAADRMKESIADELSRIDESLTSGLEELRTRLKSQESYTIHRLLSFNPGTSSFSYNKNNQFNVNSIFIIDEASMIDIEIFKSLLEAIPTGARVFILGDEHQLPSVQAGAILGELLKEKKDSIAELRESMRFNSNSQVGLLSEALQAESPVPESMVDFKPCSEWLSQSESFSRIKKGKKTTQDSNPVLNLSLSPDNKGDQVKKLIGKWADEFFTSEERNLVKLASGLNRQNVTNRQLADLWNASNEAKILCAERQGSIGVEELNGLMSGYVKPRHTPGDYYAGQLLMITKNQGMFSLYNGDCGILVSFNDSSILYFMVEKKVFGNSQAASENNSEEIFRIGDFLFYPVYLFPRDSVETAYAITIHKSQGSGYKNIMVFLPEKEGHPLLNRQILYTAITRTKGTTCIVSTRDLVEYARNTVIRRDTKILLSE